MKAFFTVLAVIGLTLAALALLMVFAILLGKSLGKLGRYDHHFFSKLKNSENETSIRS